MFYDQLFIINELAERLLSEAKKPGLSAGLPKDALVILEHGGYQFWFFKLSEGDNPPVYYWEEGDDVKEFRKVYERYSDFFDDYVNHSIEYGKKFGYMKVK